MRQIVRNSSPSAAGWGGLPATTHSPVNCLHSMLLGQKHSSPSHSIDRLFGHLINYVPRNNLSFVGGQSKGSDHFAPISLSDHLRLCTFPIHWSPPPFFDLIPFQLFRSHCLIISDQFSLFECPFISSTVWSFFWLSLIILLSLGIFLLNLDHFPDCGILITGHLSSVISGHRRFFS